MYFIVCIFEFLFSELVLNSYIELIFIDCFEYVYGKIKV